MHEILLDTGKQAYRAFEERDNQRAGCSSSAKLSSKSLGKSQRKES